MGQSGFRLIGSQMRKGFFYRDFTVWEIKYLNWSKQLVICSVSRISALKFRGEKSLNFLFALLIGAYCTQMVMVHGIHRKLKLKRFYNSLLLNVEMMFRFFLAWMELVWKYHDQITDNYGICNLNFGLRLEVRYALFFTIGMGLQFIYTNSNSILRNQNNSNLKEKKC